MIILQVEIEFVKLRTTAVTDFRAFRVSSSSFKTII